MVEAGVEAVSPVAEALAGLLPPPQAPEADPGAAPPPAAAQALVHNRALSALQVRSTAVERRGHTRLASHRHVALHQRSLEVLDLGS